MANQVNSTCLLRGSRKLLHSYGLLGQLSGMIGALTLQQTAHQHWVWCEVIFCTDVGTGISWLIATWVLLVKAHHQLFELCACVLLQAELLHGQIGQLQQQLQLAAEHEQQVQQEAAAAAEDRLEIELRQQQLKYERQIQVWLAVT